MSRRNMLYFVTIIGVAILFTSCTPNSTVRSHHTAPYLMESRPAIVTDTVVLKGDMGEILEINFDENIGTCKNVVITNSQYKEEEFSCDDKRVAEMLPNTYFCVPERIANKDYNATVEGQKVYCGSIKSLTDGADIQFQSKQESENVKCKYMGGYVICY